MAQIKHVALLPERNIDSYKNSFGRVLIIGGSISMSGAASMSGMSALRSGAGLVEIATGQSVWQIVAQANPEYMVTPLLEKEGSLSEKAIFELKKRVKIADVVAFGPGIGVSQGVKNVLRWLISQENLPVVIDADGLNCLSQIDNWYEIASAQLILTPHPGEFKCLWNSLSRESMPKSRSEVALEFTDKTGVTLILKGNATVVASDGNHYINDTGNPGMATAGSGDVLTGMVAAFWAQWILQNAAKAASTAAVGAVWCHGRAGDIAANEFGEISMVATDIIDSIPLALR